MKELLLFSLFLGIKINSAAFCILPDSNPSDSALKCAVLLKQEELVKKALAQGDLITPEILQLACRGDYNEEKSTGNGTSIVQLLLEKKPFNLSTIPSEYNPLVAACLFKQHDIVKLLITAGVCDHSIGYVQINNIHKNKLFVGTPLLAALKREKHYSRPRPGFSILCRVFPPDHNLIRFLLESGAEVNTELSPYKLVMTHEKNQNKITSYPFTITPLLALCKPIPLHISQNPVFKKETYMYDSAKVLLEYGADVSSKDVLRRTALHNAISSNNKKMAELLLHYKANGSAKDFNRNTPLHYAAKQGHSKELVQLLLKCQKQHSTIKK